MVKYRTFAFLAIAIFTVSCSTTAMKTLKSGKRVPLNREEYPSREKFDKKILDQIDNSFFYKQISSYSCYKSNFEIDWDYLFDDFTHKDYPEILQIYDNGAVRQMYPSLMFPDYESGGTRGNLYMDKDSDIKLAMFEISYSGPPVFNLYNVKVEGDYIILQDQTLEIFGQRPKCYKYKKSDKVPEEYRKYQADW